MFFAPISKAVTEGASNSKDNRAGSWSLWGSAWTRVCLLLLVCVSMAAAEQSALVAAVVQNRQNPQAAQHGQQGAASFDELAGRAAAARDGGNLPLAIDLYGQAERVKPDWAEGWFYLGMLQYSANAYPAAIDAFNHLLVLQPGMPPGMALRGLCEFETGAYDDALRDLEQAVAKGAANQPRNEQILRYHLAELLTRSSRFQDALAQYKFFAAKKIEDEDVLVGMGLAGMRVALLTKDVPAGDREMYQAAGAQDTRCWPRIRRRRMGYSRSYSHAIRRHRICISFMGFCCFRIRRSWPLSSSKAKLVSRRPTWRRMRCWHFR